MALKKDVAGVEDLTFGTGTVTQQRNGKDVTVTQINSSHIPYDDTTKIDEAVDRVESIIEAHKNDFNNPHQVDPEDLDVAPLHHTHPISDVDGLQQALDNKSEITHEHDNRYSKLGHTHEISDVDGLQTDIDNLQTQITANDGDIANLEADKAPTVHQHQISDVENLQSELDSKALIGDSFLKSEHIQEYNSAGDAGKPIILASDGKIHPSLMGSGMYFVGTYTPEASNEYPDSTGENVGAYWEVIGVDDTNGYTFTGGDLVGETVNNGDFVILGSQGWGVVYFTLDPAAYYKIDGSLAITAPFAGGGQQVKNIASGTENGDAVEYSQIVTFSQDFLKLDGSSPMEAHLDMGTFQIKNGVDGIEDTDFATVGQISSLVTGFMKLDGSTPMEAALDAGGFPVTNIGESTDSLNAATYGQLSAHTGDTDNPHSVTANQVGALTPDGDGSQLTGITANQVGALPVDGIAEDSQKLGGIDKVNYIPNYGRSSEDLNSFEGQNRVDGLSHNNPNSPGGGHYGTVTTLNNYDITIQVSYPHNEGIIYTRAYVTSTWNSWHTFTATLQGEIKQYSGKLSDLPNYWHICDGTKGTPDMTEDFKTYGAIEVVYIQFIGEQNDD